MIVQNTKAPQPAAQDGGNEMLATEKTIAPIVDLLKGRGIIYPGSEI